jgi:hypothetical protein
MSWSISLIVMASLSAHDAQTTYDSYTQAYWTASAAKRPMLVILNPADQVAEPQKAIELNQLQQNERTRKALDNYVVAIIDTGTEHGKTVHGLFGSPQLPRIVVIDERQDKQVFQSSEPLLPSALATVLEKHRTNSVVPAAPGSFNSFQQPGGCPNCRRF